MRGREKQRMLAGTHSESGGWGIFDAEIVRKTCAELMHFWRKRADDITRVVIFGRRGGLEIAPSY